MEKVVFNNVSEPQLSLMKEIFMLIKEGKEKKKMDEELIKEKLGSIYISKFWHPTEAERLEWRKKWFSTPLSERSINNEKLKIPWDFGGWIDALQNCDLHLSEFKMNDHGNHEILFRQLSHPSGGLDALDELVKIFDGNILESTGI